MIDRAKIGTIEKGIPMPDAVKYPFAKMKVGDSFLVSWNGNRRATQNAVRSSIYRYCLRHKGKKKYSCRSQKDGVRIWRTA